MANLRRAKRELKQLLSGEDWKAHLDEIAAGGKENIGALISFLTLEPEMMHRSAIALGRTIAKIYESNPEVAKDLIRRFMWQMNEESGNIGWGIPAAFAEALAASPELARQYAQILASYIMDLDRDDNFCDHDILRRTCYWAVGRLAKAQPELMLASRPWLLKGLKDRDSVCRGMAAWALAQLPQDIMDAPALNRLIGENNKDKCDIFENGQLYKAEVGELAKKAATRRS